jgi:hypothetical protein
MLVRFWRTRSSIPVCPAAADIRRQTKSALSMAISKEMDSPEKLRRLNETKRFEKPARGDKALKVSAAIDGTEVEV